MLRVGLTGELGSGKSTVARLLAAHGAIVFSSDEMGRAMMQPGEAVYRAIVERFGPVVVLADGQLDRPALSRLAFNPEHPRVEELNAIVHPAVIAEQQRLLEALAQTNPNAIAVVESALLFTTKHAGSDEPWRKRFDVVVLVTAPDATKIERFVSRVSAGRQLDTKALDALKADSLARLAIQRITAAADLTIENNSGVDDLTQRVNALWIELTRLRTSQLKTHD